MKAAIWPSYGPPEVLCVDDIPQPLPKQNEVLVRVIASSVNAGDLRLRSLNVPKGFKTLTRLAFGIKKPRVGIPGMDFSGVVEAVGRDVNLFKAGDEVCGTRGMAMGAHADYVCVPQTAPICIKPEELDHQHAASILFGGQTAIDFFKNKLDVGSNQHVLINGAAGNVGSMAVQIAQVLGAEVTAVCRSENFELAKSLGAQHTMDYRRQTLAELNKTYDVIFDTAGNLSSQDVAPLLKKEGKLVCLTASLTTILMSIVNKRLLCGVAQESKESLDMLMQLSATGKLRAIIEKTFPLVDIAKAHNYSEHEKTKGSVVVVMADS